MAKKKKKVYFRKKSQKKQKKQQKEEKCELSEVDKELYEIQISELNAKLNRVKEHYEELRIENDEIKRNLTQLDEDRADVISYLKKDLKCKVEEISELWDRVNALQEIREKENTQFLNEINNKESELHKLREQLTTEISLLNGKLNVLDEFRAQREDLMAKFRMQEETQKQQEIKYQEMMRDMEKDFILKKNRMKKEVEENLIKLSEDFQAIMQSKIGSTTKITISENAALRYEMNKMMETCKMLIRENDKLKHNEFELKLKYSSLTTELENVLRKYILRKKELDAVRKEHEILKSSCISLDEHNLLREKIQILIEEVKSYKIDLQRQISNNEELQKNFDSVRQREVALNEKLIDSSKDYEKINFVIRKAAAVIKNAILDSSVDFINDYTKRTELLSSLLEILKEGLSAKESNQNENFFRIFDVKGMFMLKPD